MSKYLNSCLLIAVELLFQCSVTCSQGIRSRVITCNNKSGDEVDYDKCTKKKPRNVKRCHKGPCPKWYPSKWSKVSIISPTFVKKFTKIIFNARLDFFDKFSKQTDSFRTPTKSQILQEKLKTEF